jgi:RNA polymerase sigma-70 factor (ECF subfamily)
MIERVPLAVPRTFAEEPALPATPRAPAHEFTTVYADWFRTVYRWLRALGGPEADVEDLTQEVFVVVQRRLPSFDGRHLSAWLYVIAARTLSDHRRRRWFRDLFRRALETDPDDLEAARPDSEALLAQKQEQQRFYRLVAQMSPKWRDSFVLFEVEGYRGEEIALLTGRPVATVRTHLHRARKQFLALVAKEER